MIKKMIAIILFLFKIKNYSSFEMNSNLIISGRPDSRLSIQEGVPYASSVGIGDLPKVTINKDIPLPEEYLHDMSIVTMFDAVIDGLDQKLSLNDGNKLVLRLKDLKSDKEYILLNQITEFLSNEVNTKLFLNILYRGKKISSSTEDVGKFHSIKRFYESIKLYYGYLDLSLSPETEKQTDTFLTLFIESLMSFIDNKEQINSEESIYNVDQNQNDNVKNPSVVLPKKVISSST